MVSKAGFWLSLIALVGLAGCASTRQGPETWRFAIEETRGSVQDAYARRFKELIEEKSGGQIRVKIYPYGALGTSDQTTELLYNGTLQFAMASPGHLGKLIPEVQVLLLHYLFAADQAVNREVLEDPELKRAFDELYAEKGFQLLSIYSEGWQVWTTNEPIHQPSDFEGVKFRVMTSPLLLAAYQAYGASSTPLPYGEVYSALQLKMIDGQVNPIFAIQEMSFYEVCDYLIFARQAQFFTTAVANRKFYQELSPERRGMVDEVIAQLHGEIFDLQKRYNQERLEQIKEARPGIQVVRLTPEERARFVEASLPVRQRYVELAGPRGQKLLDLVVRLVDEAQASRDSKSSRRRDATGAAKTAASLAGSALL